MRERLKGVRNSELNASEMASELEFEKENESDNGVFEFDYDEEDNIESEEKEYLAHVQQKAMSYELADNARF